MELLEPGLGAGLALTLYTLIDKVVVPLIRGRNGNGNGAQKVKNDEFERRLNRLDDRVDSIQQENRQAHSEISKNLGNTSGMLETLLRRQ